MKKSLIIALLITIINFIVHFVFINDYGLTWDYHFHYYSGLFHLGLPVPKADDPYPIPFTPPDPRLTIDDPFGPIMSVIPALSQQFFYDKWKLLPLDIAYNLPSVIFGSIGVGIIYLFMSQAFNPTVGLFSSLLLSLLPVYFGYTHNNMKDIPNAVMFALTLYFFWRLVKFKKIKDLIISSFFFAIAFNFKINSIFIPLICLLWYLSINYRNIFSILKNKIALFFLLAPIFALIVWWPFWKDPLGKLLLMPSFFSKNTLYMPVLFSGKIIFSGVNIPLSYPYTYLAVTTPLPILTFFIIGLITGLYKIFTNSKYKSELSLLLLWFFVPLLRYLSPQMGAIDGVRHFLEVVFPLCAIASFGLYTLINFLSKLIDKIKYFIFAGPAARVSQTSIHLRLGSPRSRHPLQVIFFIVISLFLIKNIIVFHPYQTSFYNSLIGGIKGAEGKFDIDFWGTPQKEAVFWLNKNAPLNSKIFIAMAQSSAATYLRSDLLQNVNKSSLLQSDYVVILNRQSFFKLSGVEDYINNTEFNNKIVFKRTIESVPLVWVSKNH